MAELFDLDAFIAGINQDKQQPKNSKDRLNKVLMNTRNNQGTLTFIPCYSKSAGNFYMKLPRVYEYYGDTSLLDAGEAWYRILPLEFYGDLTESQKELYHEVKGYLDFLNDSEEVDRDEFRVRNYSLFFGICLKLKNTEDKEVEDYKDCPCLFVYPSLNPINQLCDAVNAKIDNMGGNRNWIPRVLSLEPKGRRGVLQVKFTKSAGVGYDGSVLFHMNNSDEGIIAIDPEYEISADTFAKFDDVIPCFLGWNYDSKNSSYFNEVAFKELRDQLKVRVKTMNAEPEDAGTVENKNNLNPSSAPRKPF